VPGAIFGIPTRPTTGQGMVWSESLGGRLDPGSLSNTGGGLSGFTDNRIAFGSVLGGLEDSASLTFDGTTLAAPSVTISGLTSGRVPFASTGGLLTDDGDLTFDGTTLTLGANGVLTIAKTTGTTLVVSSTAATCATFAGGATFGNNVAASLSTGATVSAAGTATNTVAGVTVASDVGTTMQMAAYGSAEGGTTFGVTRSAWGFIGVNANASANGILIGCRSVDKPIVFGVNASEVARFTGGTIASNSFEIKYSGQSALAVTGGATFGAGTTGRSSIRLPHGVAPTAPVDGDMWTTTAGLFVRINGATVGPLS
jgi:hypothetical protein